MTKVKIIAQSDIYNVCKIVEEKDAEKELDYIKKMYEQLNAHHKLNTEEYCDNGLLVTTHLIKE